MKKKLLLLVVCLSLLCGCANTQIKKKTDTEKVKFIFVEVERTGYWRIVYHKDTKVMYAVSEGSYNHGTFTLLVNADGTPMLYEDGAE